MVEVSQSGNKLTLRRDDGSLLEDVDAENVVLVPETMKDLERHPLVFQDSPPDSSCSGVIYVHPTVFMVDDAKITHLRLF